MILTEKEIINRIGYFRNKKNLSQRELSLRLGYSETWCYRVEKGEINLRISNLLDILSVLEISLEEFLYYDITKFEEDSEILNLLKSANKEDKRAICQLLKSRK